MHARLVPLLCLVSLLGASAAAAQDVTLSLRYQVETVPGSERYHRLVREEMWKPEQTAVIVCDVWDLHHSLNAVRRVEEFAPRLNDLLSEARRRGMTIVHSPSDCMEAYTQHPARLRALNAPKAANLPDDIESWCCRIPTEERAVYPVDQSDGGDDDDPAEHSGWVEKLHRLRRNVGTPWKSQTDLIEIDAERDYISDRGDEVWNVLEQHRIKNVILTGVHTNMCVLGRPFGLRQMARNGKNVVLVRDMTDTMYNPARWPYVSHFTGNDLIVSHIEKFVCPTVTSDQIVGGEEFRFKGDRRPHVAIVMAEDEYHTNQSIPKHVALLLGKHFRVSLVFGSDEERNDIPGLEALEQADVAMLSIRRRVLPPEQMAIVKQFVASGKPVVGIRTASHAFSLRNAATPEGYVAWPEFDAQVFGGNYTNHHGNELASTVAVVADVDHPILSGLTRDTFAQGGSLYRTSPLASGATVLLTGTVEGHAPEPVAWTFLRQDGGRSFYTSMGHPQDFENPEFVGLLINAVHWAAGTTLPEDVVVASGQEQFTKHWSLVDVPGSWDSAAADVLNRTERTGPWYRCAVRLRDKWIDPTGITIELPNRHSDAQVWFNGRRLRRTEETTAQNRFSVDRGLIEANDANLLVVRLDPHKPDWKTAPRVWSANRQLELKGRWQFRIGEDPTWSNIPLPARYGTSPDIIFEP